MPEQKFYLSSDHIHPYHHCSRPFFESYTISPPAGDAIVSHDYHYTEGPNGTAWANVQREGGNIRVHLAVACRGGWFAHRNWVGIKVVWKLQSEVPVPPQPPTPPPTGRVVELTVRRGTGDWSSWFIVGRSGSTSQQVDVPANQPADAVAALMEEAARAAGIPVVRLGAVVKLYGDDTWWRSDGLHVTERQYIEGAPWSLRMRTVHPAASGQGFDLATRNLLPTGAGAVSGLAALGMVVGGLIFMNLLSRRD